MEEKLTHFDGEGNARMVDISEKQPTERMATAEGYIEVQEAVLEAVMERKVKKGDVLGVAQVAGIMAVKQTSGLIPLCHSLLIQKCDLWFSIDAEKKRVYAHCTVGLQGKTGAEMEALTGVSVALLTVYDMCKAIDKRMRIQDIHLVEKSGGKSGNFRED